VHLGALLPYRRFAIDSPLPVAVAHTRLVSAVGPKGQLRFGAKTLFEGVVGSATFEIERPLAYSRGSRPQIRGTLTAAGSGTIVEGTMTLGPLTRAFLIFWFSGVALGCIGTVLALASGSRDPLVMVPVALLIVGGGSLYGGFAFDARRTLGELGEVLEGATTLRPLGAL
jgi:hypothetical protein